MSNEDVLRARVDRLSEENRASAEWRAEHDGRINAYWEAQHSWNAKQEVEMTDCLKRVTVIEKRVAVVAACAALLGGVLGTAIRTLF